MELKRIHDGEISNSRMSSEYRSNHPSIFDIMVLVMGYAISFGLPKIAVLEVALSVVRNGVPWLVLGWDCVLEALILGPSLAGPVIYVVHHTCRPVRALRTGTALWCGIGVIKSIQIILYYLFYGRLVMIPTRAFLLFGAIYSTWTLAIVLRRGWRGRSWTEVVGVFLGIAWSVHFGFNIYKLLFKGQMTTL